jgi:hypothetical protein
MTMRAIASFALVSATTIAVVGWLLGFAFGSADETQAIWTSAGVAFLVQLFAFAIARVTAATNLIAGWGLGVLLRFIVLAAYALLVIRWVGLPPTPALVSLAAFFFLSTLVEPVLLKL